MYGKHQELGRTHTGGEKPPALPAAEGEAGVNAINIIPGGRVFAPFTGTITFVDPKSGYVLFQSDDDETVLELSDVDDELEDSDYEKFGVKFEKDFPDYRVEERMESVYEVYYAGTDDFVDIDELQKKLDDNPDYVEGDW